MAEKTPQDYANELMEMYRATNNMQNSENINQQYEPIELYTPQTEPFYSTDFDDGIGGIAVNVTTLRRLYPVRGALVTVFTGKPESRQAVETDITDESGKTNVFRLKTPVKSESQQANNGGEVPYSNYNVSVVSDGYVEQIAMNIPVFSGVISVQNIDLIPLSTAGKHNSPQIFQGGSKYDL